MEYGLLAFSYRGRMTVVVRDPGQLVSVDVPSAEGQVRTLNTGYGGTALGQESKFGQWPISVEIGQDQVPFKNNR